MAIFTAVGAAIAGAIGLGATAASLIGAGLATAASLGFTYFTRQKQKPQTSEPRVALAGSLQTGADTNAFTIYGRSKMVGQWLYYAAWGEGDKHNAYVYKLGNTGLTRFDGLDPYVIFYGQKHTLISATKTGQEDEHWKVEGFGDLISIRWYSGKPGQVADTKLVSDTAGLDKPFTADMKFTAESYVVVEQTYDQEAFANGKPNYEWVPRGLRHYDWRKDSTVTGGSGTHRIDDPTTWEWTANSVINRAAFQMGLKGRISGRTIIGQGLPFSGLHLASYTIGANACDVQRTKGGRTFSTYTLGMAVDSNMDQTEVLKDFDEAVAGYALNASGLQGIIVGAPRVPVGAIEKKDIRDDGGQSGRNDRRSRESYNHMTGQFMSIEALWKPESLKPVTVAADVTADKRARTLAYDLTQLYDPDVAQYVLNVRYRQGRLGAARTLPISEGFGRTVEAGDTYTLDGKTWLTMHRGPGDGGKVMQLSETSNDIFLEDDIEVGPIVVTPTPPVFSAVTQVSNLQMSPGVETSLDGLSTPVLIVTWDTPTDPRITGLMLRSWIKGTTNVESTIVGDPSEGRTVLRGLSGTARYVIEAAYIFSPPRTPIWSPQVEETTGGSPPPADGSVTLSSLSASVDSVLAHFYRVQDLLEQLQAATASNGSLEAINRYNEDGRIQALVSRLGEQAEALVVQESTARTSAIEALASQALLVQAALGEATATGLMKIEASVTPDGLTTRYSFLARASTEDDFKEAGMILEVVSDGGTPPTLTSRVAFSADKFVFDDGTQPFSIQSGNVFVNDLFFHRLRSDPDITSHSIDINGDLGTIRVQTAP